MFELYIKDEVKEFDSLREIKEYLKENPDIEDIKLKEIGTELCNKKDIEYYLNESIGYEIKSVKDSELREVHKGDFIIAKLKLFYSYNNEYDEVICKIKEIICTNCAFKIFITPICNINYEEVDADSYYNYITPLNEFSLLTKHKVLSMLNIRKNIIPEELLEQYNTNIKRNNEAIKILEEILIEIGET